MAAHKVPGAQSEEQGARSTAKEVFPGVTIDPQVVHGRPVIAGTRVPVEVVVGELASGSSFDDIRQDYHLTDEQIRAALAYAAHLLGSTTVYAAS